MVRKACLTYPRATSTLTGLSIVAASSVRQVPIAGPVPYLLFPNKQAIS
jgi:hypothetical protein